METGTPHNILTELKMSSDKYNLVTAMYYVCFLIYEGELLHCRPASILLPKRVRPSVWQARIVVCEPASPRLEVSGLLIVL